MRDAYKHGSPARHECIGAQTSNSLVPLPLCANDRSQNEGCAEMCDEIMPSHGVTVIYLADA
jgi:hypothetical protein